jgi:multiple sugar transport system ATP-binding protein
VAAVTIRGLVKVFPPAVRAVDDLSLDLGDGEVVALLGAPGCGKSTLLKLLAGITAPTRGEILFDGVDVADATPPERGVAMVFQRPALYPRSTVAANIGFPLRTASVRPARVQELVLASARATGVEGLLTRLPAELTVDQQQRVALARAIVRRPGLLLFDEPVSQFAGREGERLLAETATLARALGSTALYVTPDRGDVPAVADRIGVLRDGRIEDLGPPARVRARPATAFVASIVGGPSTTLLEGGVQVEEGGHVAVWIGDAPLVLPWRDLLARQLAHFHGDRVLVGVPAEALALAGPAPNAVGAPVLPGVVRRVVPLGPHGECAVDVGGTPVDPDSGRRGARGPLAALRSTGRSRPLPGGRRHGRLGPRLDLSAIPRVTADHPAELVVRTPPAVTPRVGAPVAVRVDLSRVHFFDAHGRRIGAGWR